MAAEANAGANGVAAVNDLLKPFYQRASEAEERLSRLEAVIANKKDVLDTHSTDFSSIVKEFQSKLELAQQELISEREKAAKEIQKLAAENAKLHYRILHLVRALREADAKSPLTSGP